ncbi:discoidin domain-containing protein [Algoriphagus vanfongensis]|uniref:discoidin domain-containing protein n=1 Tax=Algoriphagus vanfongensis TaxID=426371 RepID=UPI000407AF69|nr:discoidin domain-containing protein [Algoriphagus vanfongensis]
MMRKIFKITFLVALQLVAMEGFAQQNNLSLTGTADASFFREEHTPENAIDGKPSTWKSGVEGEEKWLMVRLPGATEILKLELDFGTGTTPPQDFQLQKMHNGMWQNIQQVKANDQSRVILDLKNAVLTDRIRFFARTPQEIVLAELAIYGQEYVDSSAMDVRKVLVNQSGYNLNRPKRFSAPSLEASAAFEVRNVTSGEVVYQGELTNHIGDFSAFNPQSTNEYIVVVEGEESFPFRIGVNWLERVTYRNMIDFMIGARHYIGTTQEIRPLSWEWRDGDFFNWAQQSLVSLYLSNPHAFDRMEQTIHYVPNADFPEAYKGKWGALEPFAPSTPDIVQLIHWDADVKLSQGLEHEMQKAELAYFLYAWPYLKQWLPRSNFDQVYDYVKGIWTKETVGEYSTTKYDLSPSHNLLALKTQMGTTKGELPPGHSVVPNLMMYEVALREGDPDADRYFQAAYRQMAWMIANLDWEDPMTTKGQRMSEHITMRAFAFFQSQYPDKAPKGLQEKVSQWAEVMVSRSANYWDFRKFSEEEWTPPSWNETGNVLGFPAAAFAAISVIDDEQIKNKLEIIAWAHLDNAFGRNPTGRHFSYRGPKEIEGVDLGWYSYHKGGYGLLDEVRFVFDGSPKSFHYPNHPEVGNLGWTEGWVQFNTAFNLSMAYMANQYSYIKMERQGEKLQIVLQAPLNFDQTSEETVQVMLRNKAGHEIPIKLTEQSPYDEIFVSQLDIKNDRVLAGSQFLPLEAEDELWVSYGYGFMKKAAHLTLKK